MNRKRTTYQHGNLPAALAEAVIELVGERGVRGFSLAEAARRSGVSNSAPYRHFADRDALLVAVATQAYAEFGALIAAAKRKHRSPRLQLQSMVRAYVNYANSDRARFEILFNSGLDKRGYPALERAGDEALGTLVNTVAELVPGAPERIAEAALAFRACAHGFAMLALDGSLSHQGLAPRAIVDAAARAVLRLVDSFADSSAPRRPGGLIPEVRAADRLV
jgi:AcrR family transcriptional regulator